MIPVFPASSARSRSMVSPSPLGSLEKLTLVHLGLFGVAATWAFGGNADSVRTPLCIWGSLGGLILIAAVADRRAWRERGLGPLKWLWPILAFNLLVIAATLNPSFRAMAFEGETVYANTGGRPGWPSSAMPALAVQSLWAFDAIWIACFNLMLVVRHRRGLRRLLLVLVANALALSVFGTVQKLSRAEGLFFDAVPSPQEYFFASFVYHNHWGAYLLLLLAASLGLTWHYARRIAARNFLHSPILAGLAVLLLLAATIPLSGSRSSTLFAGLLLGGAFLQWMRQLIRKRREFHESILPPVLGTATALVLLAAGTWFVAGDVIHQRLEKTREQVATMRERGTIGDRALLYADTWRMARSKPWFGWGMGSYPHVFTLYNTKQPADRLPVFYHDAHSDWLQALAEHGIAGTALLGACALVPLLSLRSRVMKALIPQYLLAGCALVVLYAAIEFPFGNFAVVLYWWLCFFLALQYARLTRTPADASPAPAAGAASPA